MKRKTTLVLIALVMIMSIMFTGCSRIIDIIRNQKDEKEQILVKTDKTFSELCGQFVEDMIAEDALNAHYTVSNPADYGVEFDEEDFIVGRLEMDEIDESYEELEVLLAQFKSYSDSELSESEQYSRRVICAYLENQLNYQGTDYLVNLFAPSSGIISNLSTNFVEYAFFDESDVKEYLLFLKDVPVFMEEVFEFTRIQSEKGYFMPDYVADQSIKVCEQFINAENNPMLVTFEDKINKLDISSEKKKEYIELNEKYVKDYYNPVYSDSIDLLEELKGTAKNSQGLSKYGKIGDKYYAAIVKEKTSYNITPKKLTEYLDESIDDCFNAMAYIYMKDEDAYYKATEYQPKFNSPNEVMDFLLDNIEGEFPKPVTTEYVIEYQNPACEIENVLAYYLTCRIDDVDYNSIKVNGSAVGNDKLTLYSTLAHEGIPGHMYQFTTAYDSEDINDACKFTSFIGMSEGWAEYASTLCLEYLDMPDYYSEMIYLNDMISYLVCSRLDLGVNYEGWSKKDAEEFLAEYYYLDDEMLDELYYMVIGDPGQFLPYTFGHLKMREFRNYAEEKLGNGFNEKEYHEFILSLGITSLDILEQELKSWVAEQ